MELSQRTKELNERFLKVMPGGHSNLKVPLIDRPLFFAKGKGARIWDVDGKDYIEYWNGAGPGILGYGNEEYLEALRKQLETLPYLFSGVGLSEVEIELAEKMVHYIPCADKVRFAVSGSEAVQLAIRLARGYTGRPYFIRFDGHYHGWMDNVLGGAVNPDLNSAPFPVEDPHDYLGTAGKAPDALKQGFLLPWNEIEVLGAVLKKYGDQVAMVHMEPILCNGGGCPPRPGYLESVRDLCNQYGIVLSFDEVITGFRVGLSGAQGALGVTPDIATFGKAMGAGIPVAAVAGKKEIMDQLLERKVIGAGTYNGHPLSMAASLATIKILERDDGAVYKQIERVQKKLGDGLKEITKKHDLPVVIQGPRGALFHHFIDAEVVYSAHELHMGADDMKSMDFNSKLIDEGVLALLGGRWYISTALTEADVDETLERAERAMNKI